MNVGERRSWEERGVRSRSELMYRYDMFGCYATRFDYTTEPGNGAVSNRISNIVTFTRGFANTHATV